MAELKDLLPHTSKLSLLYIDEDQKYLSTMTNAFSKVFKNVDDANDAVLGLDYLKVNKYDLVIVDASSIIMSTQNLIKNIRQYNKFQEILLTSSTKSKDEIISFYELSISAFQSKPIQNTKFLNKILEISLKINHHKSSQKEELDILNDEISSQKKHIGRFMMNEKNLLKQIESYKDSIHIKKNIYELTKLPNRFALQDSLDEREHALIYINIDHFDFVNTTYGMGKANKLLKETAKILGLYLPTNASLYHITADEYVILLDEPAEDQAFILSSQVQALFKESPVEFDGHSQYIVFSIGIDSGSGKKLFINAKAASKEARFFGGNKIVRYDAYSKYMKDQRESLYWVGILKHAFDEDKIFTYYQPMVSNDNSDVKHYEVLCRLMDDKNRLVDANMFINSAKQVGLITQITKIVIDRAFKTFEKNNYHFSINISIYDLHEEYLLHLLDYKCEKYNISKERVYLEIVEDIIVSTEYQLDDQIIELKNAGYHVIIDDFGTDKSAYNRMFDLNAEYIKIDGTFIKELLYNDAHRIVVESIVIFAKKSGIKTIAEHVESQEIQDVVKELGIDYSQGYFIGKPSVEF